MLPKESFGRFYGHDARAARFGYEEIGSARMGIHDRDYARDSREIGRASCRERV